MINWYLLISAVFVWSIVYFLDDNTAYSKTKQFNIKEVLEYLATVLSVTIFIVSTIAMFVSFFILKDENIAFICIAFLVGSLVLYCYIEENKKERKRRAKLSAWAKLHDWSYDCDHNLNSSYLSFFNRLNKGSNRYVFDMLRGKWGQYTADAFNFHYEITWGDSQKGITTVHHFGVILIYLDKAFCNLIIKPRGILSLGGIQFESVEFGEEFIVHSRNARFAYDFCHPKVMKYLLMQRNVDLELKENILAMFIDCDRLVIEDIEESLERLIQIRQLMPKYLFRS